MTILPVAWLCWIPCLWIVCEAYTIVVSIQPNDAIAGIAFTTQPQIQIYESDGSLASTFNGYVYAELSSGPTGFESLYYDGSTEPTENAVAFNEGKAQFSGLYINEEGSGYILQFIAAKSSGSLQAFEYSDEFAVSLGDAYQIGFFITPGNAEGGSAFLPQPVISVQDQGGNTLTTENTGSVTVFLAENPNNGTLRPSNMLTQYFEDGYATFASLYINEAGSGYVLGFNTTLDLEGPTYLESNSFDVGVGDASYLTILEDASVGTVYAGEAFPNQPKVEVRDAGGNILTTDSENAIQISISQNPSSGTIYPEEDTEVVLTDGIAHFGNLHIDAVGVAYVVRYTFLQLDSTGLAYETTDIYVDGEEFDVNTGHAYNLIFSQEADSAWAGGQPFQIQPYLELQDIGDNHVDDDETEIFVYMVPSLVMSRTVVIDTIDAEAAYITRVYASNDKGFYGVGHNIQIVVEFNQEVTVTASSAYLVLDIQNGSNYRHANCISLNNRSESQFFLYTIHKGEWSDALDYLDVDSFKLSADGNVTNNCKKLSNLTLPDPGGSLSLSNSNISVFSSPPNITFLYTTTPAGEYGVGEDIFFVVNYSYPVVVEGVPILPLNLGPNGSHSGSYASYYGGSGSPYLAFHYRVDETENVTALDIHGDARINLTDGAAIYLSSTNPSLLANLDIPNNISATKTVTIDTTVPSIDPAFGVWSSPSEADFTAGDYFHIYVKFTKPVTVTGTLELWLETGDDHDYVADYESGSGTDTLTFFYTVQLLDESPDLNYYSNNALLLSSGSSVKRTSTNPLQDADLSLAPATRNGTALVNNSDIVLDGTYPYVTEVFLSLGTVDNSTYNRSDTVYICVNFSAPVAVVGTPVLKLDLYFIRDAEYYKGNNTATLHFAYTIQLGDTSPNLAYRYSPNALCLNSGCDDSSETTDSIKRLSMKSELDATLTLSKIGGTSSLGVPIGHSVVISTSGIQHTSYIVGVSMTEPAVSGLYGAGTEMIVMVEFSDEMTMTLTSKSPELYINTGDRMVFFDGEGTKYWYFLSMVAEGQNVSEVDWEPFFNYTGNYTELNNDTYSALICPPPYCELVNNQGITLYNDMSNISSLNSGVQICTTVPYIVDVYTDKPTSPYDGTYTVGEEIYVYVVFDKTIKVLGQPMLEMETGDVDQFAEYVGYEDYTITFLYTVQDGDSADNLTYSGVNAIDLLVGGASVLKDSDNPETNANITLPEPTPLARNGSTVQIRTDDVPYVMCVHATSPNGTYTPGDNITIQLDFSEVVIITGTPLLYMELGVNDRFAVYTGGSGTKHAYFNFTVVANDLNYDLDYVSCRSLEVGIDEQGNEGTMLQISTNPTQELTLELPCPGTNVSLSGTSDIFVDGRTPYITRINISEPDGTYGFGDKLHILVTFSFPVAVDSEPMILLDTGSILRYANYKGGHGTNVLIFEYKVMVGDMSDALDYYAAEEDIFSAVNSFDLCGGWIRRYSSNPTLPADIHLNPVHAELEGTLSVTAEAGYAWFRDLKIIRQGPDYKLRFYCYSATNGRLLTSAQTIWVVYSSEFEIMSDDQKSEDRFGHSLDLNADTIVVGAPYKPWPTSEIQTITTSASSSEFQNEVQWVILEAGSQKEIQTFTTFSDPYTTVGGYFKLGYENWGPTRSIPADSTAEQVATWIEQDMPGLLGVTVSRNTYTYCACANGYEWTVTFDDLVGKVSEMDTYGNLLTGDGAQITEITTIQNSPVLNGTLCFSMDGFSGANGTTETRKLNTEATAEDIEEALAEDLGLRIMNVSVSTSESGLQIVWEISFSNQEMAYDVPQLTVAKDGLIGGGFAWIQTMQNGMNPLNGTWRARWRESNYTNEMWWDVTAAELESELESLESIENVTVTRSAPDDEGGYEWIITFEEFNTKTAYGWEEGEYGNLEPIEIDSFLVGTDHKIEVGYRFGGAMDYPPWSPKRMGEYGYYAGAAYILMQQDDGQWVQYQKIVGDEVDDGDRFGFSVSISDAGDRIMVGAPYDEEYGENEKQSIYCDANNGTFKLSFRGFTTLPISWNVTYWDLKKAIVGDFGTTEDLHSIPRINMDLGYWNNADKGTPLCDNNTVILEFIVPQDGDLEELEPSTSALNGTLVVEEVVKGTNNPTAPGAFGAQKGAVYFFRKRSDGVWEQTDKVTSDSEVGIERFGYSVSIFDDWAIVGSPGEDSETGKVYIFWPSDDYTWEKIQVLEARDAGSWFGHSVSIYDDVLVVGAPQFNNSQGSAHIYRVGGSSEWESDDECIYGSTITDVEVVPGAYLGWSVDIHQDTIVVGAPYNDDYQIYLGSEIPDDVTQASGSAFVFVDTTDGYEYGQRLIGTNIKLNDRFGYGVSTYGDETIVVSSLQEYIGDLITYKPVQVVRTSTSSGSDGENVGSVFRIGWKVEWNDETGEFETRWTSLLESDITGPELKDILEEELDTGEVTVKRSGPELETGGYAWSITFNDIVSESDMVLLEVDGSTLSGDDPVISMEEAIDIGFRIRGIVHLFRKDDSGEWLETAFLAPKLQQQQDLFGESVSVHDQLAVVGAPNRDVFASGLNSGSVMTFKLDFMHVGFENPSYNVTEGDGIFINIVREDDPNLNYIGFDVKSLDRNPDSDLSDYVEELFGLHFETPNFKTHTDMVGAGTAYGRSQYYGSYENRSEWVGGMFDYRGVSDYVQNNETRTMGEKVESITTGFNSTGDTISEHPDETVRLILMLPGVYPSLLGSMTTLITIEDDGDGYLATENRMGFEKLEFEGADRNQQFGSAVAVDDEPGIVVIGTPGKDFEDILEVGRAYVFQRVLGIWEESTELMGSEVNHTTNARFGASVAITTPYGRNDTTLIIGSPGTAQVYVFVMDDCSSTLCTWKEQAILQGTGVSPRDGFGDFGAVAIDHDIVVVGCPVLETLFVFERYFDLDENEWLWSAAASRQSSDYDYDVITIQNVTHRQDFGRAVDVSGRTIVAGSPLADYNNQGSTGVEEFDTYGARNMNKGRAYIFYSAPQVQEIVLAAITEPSDGTFKLQLLARNMLNESTSEIAFSASASTMKDALEGLRNIDEVEVEYNSAVTDVATYTWTISFVSETVDIPLLKPLYYGHGCNVCAEINQPWINDEQINVSLVSPLGAWGEQTFLSAKDKRSGDAFGYSVTIDGDYVFVGSPSNSALTATTWDFETGDLVGWTATGHAFDDQPTFGDNTRYRSVYEGYSSFRPHGKPQVSRHKGRYWIGTYELRPGAGVDNYTFPHEDYEAGSTQGDEPIGTLTSQPFIILGDTISFLIGGGCDHLTEYVELLIDGVAVARATGKCKETMEPVQWDVSSYMNRAGTIRIVDASSSRWAHINVDHFQFSWYSHGGKYETSGATESSSIHYVHKEETAFAGAVYVFRRQDNGTDESCTGDKLQCVWEEMNKLHASDKRSDNRFGFSVDYSDELGLLVVGSYKSKGQGFYHEKLPDYPYDDPTYVSFPLEEYLEGFLQMRRTFTEQPMGSGAVWHSYTGDAVITDPDEEHSAMGAIYVFKLYPEVLGSGNVLLDPPYWLPCETLKLQPHDGFARDYFGYSARISGRSLVSSAINHDLIEENAGIVYEFDIGIAHVYFAQVEFIVLEGTDDTVAITLYRDEDHTDYDLTVAYATSDLTATGVDTIKFDNCETIAARFRPGDCGDYEQSRGEVTFADGDVSTAFSIRIMNDFCYEHFMEYFQVTLSIPGTNAVIGEEFAAKVRIDDDDFERDSCD